MEKFMVNIGRMKQALLLEGAPIASILREFRGVTDSFASEQLKDWLDFELNGYPDEQSVPAYRVVTGEVVTVRKGTYLPVKIEDTELQEGLTRRAIAQPLEEIEAVLDGKNESLHIPFHAQVETFLMDCLDFEKPPELQVNAGKIEGILHAVKGEFMKWAVELQRECEKMGVTATPVPEKKQGEDPGKRPPQIPLQSQPKISLNRHEPLSKAGAGAVKEKAEAPAKPKLKMPKIQMTAGAVSLPVHPVKDKESESDKPTNLKPIPTSTDLRISRDLRTPTVVRKILSAGPAAQEDETPVHGPATIVGQGLQEEETVEHQPEKKEKVESTPDIAEKTVDDARVFLPVQEARRFRYALVTGLKELTDLKMPDEFAPMIKAYVTCLDAQLHLPSPNAIIVNEVLRVLGESIQQLPPVERVLTIQQAWQDIPRG